MLSRAFTKRLSSRSTIRQFGFKKQGSFGYHRMASTSTNSGPLPDLPSSSAPTSSSSSPPPPPLLLPREDFEWVQQRLGWLRSKSIWPNGLRYLWTDAFGVCLFISLYYHTRNESFLEEAKQVVQQVYSVLGRSRGIRIGQEPDRDGQYYHYLAMWMYALAKLGEVPLPGYEKYTTMGIELVKQIHEPFMVRSGTTKRLWWKMAEDLNSPHRDGYGFGSLDAYQGLASYVALDPQNKYLSSEMDDLRDIIRSTYISFQCDQDLGLGMMLWSAHFFLLLPPQEATSSTTTTTSSTSSSSPSPSSVATTACPAMKPFDKVWAQTVTTTCLKKLVEKAYVDLGDDVGGFIARDASFASSYAQMHRQGGGRGVTMTRFPFSRPEIVVFGSYGALIGLESVLASSSSSTTTSTCIDIPRITRIIDQSLKYLSTYKSGDKYDEEAITHVMGCCAHFPGVLLGWGKPQK